MRVVLFLVWIGCRMCFVLSCSIVLFFGCELFDDCFCDVLYC